MTDFKLYNGECDVPKNDSHIVFKHPEHGIYFSACEKGDALSCHFSSDKKSLRHVKSAINDWCDFVFNNTGYAKIVALTQRKSIDRLISKCGFVFAGSFRDINIYERCKL